MGITRTFASICNLMAMLLALASFNAIADTPPPLVLHAEQSGFDGSYRLFPHLMQASGKAGQSNAADIPALNLFTAPGQTPSVGVRADVVWATFVLRNDGATALQAMIEHTEHATHHIALYRHPVGDPAAMEEMRYDLFDASTLNTEPAARAVFPITLPADTEYRYFAAFHYDLMGAIHTDFRLWNPEDLRHRLALEQLFWGAFFAILVFTAIIALVIGLVSVDRVLIAYCAYTILSIFAFLPWSGLLQHYLLPGSFSWVWQSIPAGLAVAGGLYFSRLFLQTMEYMPKTDWLLKGLIVIGLLQVPVSLLPLPPQISGPVVLGLLELSFLSYPVLLVIGIMRWRQGNKEALYFSIAWGIYTFGVVTYALRDLGVLDTNDVTYYMPPVGTLMEIGLLTTALASRLRRLYLQRENYRERYMDSLKQKRDALEALVEERTAELEAARAHAEKEARTDSLTGLPNRRHFMRTSRESIAQAHKDNRHLSLILFDIDNFRDVNDRRGHGAGDDALQALGRAVMESCDEQDFYGRLGGEEFAVICHDSDLTRAADIAETLRDRIEKTDINNGQVPFNITISVGIAQLEAEEGLENLLKRADEVLYVAKGAGRNQIRQHRGRNLGNRMG